MTTQADTREAVLEEAANWQELPDDVKDALDWCALPEPIIEYITAQSTALTELRAECERLRAINRRDLGTQNAWADRAKLHEQRIEAIVSCAQARWPNVCTLEDAWDAMAASRNDAEARADEVERLAERWERIASTHGVRCFTGNDHLIFANELRAALKDHP